jgi:hypothetical protein
MYDIRQKHCPMIIQRYGIFAKSWNVNYVSLSIQHWIYVKQELLYIQNRFFYLRTRQFHYFNRTTLKRFIDSHKSQQTCNAFPSTSVISVNRNDVTAKFLRLTLYTLNDCLTAKLLLAFASRGIFIQSPAGRKTIFYGLRALFVFRPTPLIYRISSKFINLSSYLTENKLYLNYKNRTVNAV